MKIKLPLIGIIACLLAVFSFAEKDANTSMSYYQIVLDSNRVLADSTLRSLFSDTSSSEYKALKSLEGIVFRDSESLLNYGFNSYVSLSNICADTGSVSKKKGKRSSHRCTDRYWQNTQESLRDTSKFPKLVDALMVRENDLDTSVVVKWSGKDCGCSHKDELDGDVFGIYPFWYAKDLKWVDFEGITRLSYYGLKIDDDGKLFMPFGNLSLPYLEKKEHYDFVNKAHRHFVKLDWIVFKDDWNKLESSKLQSFFAKLTDEINQLLNKKINSPLERLVNAFTFYADEYENRGDGVTLYFKNYPKTDVATEAFRVFFGQLKKTLSSVNKEVLVNIMMDRADLADEMKRHKKSQENRGIYSYENIAELFALSENGKRMSKRQVKNELNNRLFVVVDEPVSRGKRFIMDGLNQHLDGVDRRKLLQAIVPVLWLDRMQWNQLPKDAMYYVDSYYGMGIAPYVTDVNAADTTCDIDGNPGACMIQHFENDEGKNERQGSIAMFVCKHRWLFRFMNVIAFFVAVAALVGYFVSYRLEDYFNNHLLYLLGIVVVPSTIMMIIISNFDPAVSAISGIFGMLPIFILLLVIVAILLLQVERKTDVPKRFKK